MGWGKFVEVMGGTRLIEMFPIPSVLIAGVMVEESPFRVGLRIEIGGPRRVLTSASDWTESLSSLFLIPKLGNPPTSPLSPLTSATASSSPTPKSAPLSKTSLASSHLS